MHTDRRPFALPAWFRLLTGRGLGPIEAGARTGETPLDATLKELFLQEEAKNELFLNSLILFGIIPVLALVAVVIAFIERSISIPCSTWPASGWLFPITCRCT